MKGKTFEKRFKEALLYLERIEHRRIWRECSNLEGFFSPPIGVSTAFELRRADTDLRRLFDAFGYNPKDLAFWRILLAAFATAQFSSDRTKKWTDERLVNLRLDWEEVESSRPEATQGEIAKILTEKKPYKSMYEELSVNRICTLYRQSFAAYMRIPNTYFSTYEHTEREGGEQGDNRYRNKNARELKRHIMKANIAPSEKPKRPKES